jgi:conjugative transfer signal peptidase TraF
MVGCALLGAAAIAGAAGVRVNTTRSVPVGVYLPVPAAVPSVGDYVFLCPPDTAAFQLARARGYVGAGPCPGNYEHLFKVILAAKTDTVSVDADGVRVNGRLLPDSAPLDADTASRPLPAYRYGPAALADGKVLVMTTDNPRSFDARYFGPIDAAQIAAVVRPLFVW